MPGDLDNLHRCTLGGDAFQLTDFGIKEDPIVMAGVRAAGKIRLWGEGYVLANTQSAMATAIADAIESFRVSGQDFEVFGVGGVLLRRVLAAHCMDGGPFVAFEMLGGMEAAPLQREFRFTLTADMIPEGGGGGGGDEPSTMGAVTRPDDLRTIRWAGTLSGDNLQDRFDALMARFRDEYPWPDWVVNHTFELTGAAGGSARSARFTAEAREMYQGLPASNDGNTFAVEGELRVTSDRDEQMRKVRRWEWDLLVSGLTVQPLVDALRQQVQTIVGPETPILRESVTTSLLRELRTRVVFETLSGGNGNALVNWTQSIRGVGGVIGTGTAPNVVWDERRYAGADPILVERPKRYGRLVQSGQAVGVGQWVAPPGPLLPTLLAEDPDEQFRQVNESERETSWTYVMYFDQATRRGGIPLSATARPAAPRFTTI